MFKLEKSVVLKYYSLATILCLVSYNLITHNIPRFSYIFIELAISLNLILVCYYLIYKENVVLKGSENLKLLFVACTSEYLLVWALVKLLGISQDLTIYYTNYAYLGLILLLLGLYQRFPKIFVKFFKFSLDFSYGYFLTNGFLENYSFVHILASLIISIIKKNIYDLATLDYMTVYCTNIIYSAALFEAIIILLSWFPIKNPGIIGGIGGLLISLVYYILLSTIKTQLENLVNKADDWDLENEKLSIIA